MDQGFGKDLVGEERHQNEKDICTTWSDMTRVKRAGKLVGYTISTPPHSR